MDRKNRVLEIFFRGIRGEELSPKRLATEYGLSTKTITRNLNDIKKFIKDSHSLVGYTALIYSYNTKSYRLFMDNSVML